MPAPAMEDTEVGQFGLSMEEEEWVREKMEYAMHDFQILSRAIKRYKWQLAQIPKDVERLEQLKQKHLHDPIGFLKQVQTKEFRYPANQKILPIPTVEWTKYQYPPANPIIPDLPKPITFISPLTHTSRSGHGHQNGPSNIVSLNGGSHGSPANEKALLVRESAKSLGIQINPVPYVHNPNLNHGRHSHSHNHGNGNGYSGPPEGHPYSRYSSMEPTTPTDYPPSLTAGKPSDMDGVIMDQGQRVGPRPHSPAASIRASPAPSSGSNYNITIDHSASTPMPIPIVTNNSGLSYSNVLVAHPVVNHTIQHMAGAAADGTLLGSATMNAMVGINTGLEVVGTTGGAGDKKIGREGSSNRDETVGIVKPPTYNLPWSDEEQRKLEELLGAFPDEEVQAKRFKKISKAMGTRTPKQVASRVQKYFIKLTKAGLETPGRMNFSVDPPKPKPKPVREGPPPAPKPKKRKEPSDDKGKGRARPPKGEGNPAPKRKAKSALGHGRGRISGAQYMHYSSAPTVYMSEEEDDDSIMEMLAASGPGAGSSSSSSTHMLGGESSTGYLGGRSSGGMAYHIGITCDGCHVDPIMGTRYGCVDCEVHGGINLCQACFDARNFQNDIHFLSHRLRAIPIVGTVHHGGGGGGGDDNDSDSVQSP